MLFPASYFSPSSFDTRNLLSFTLAVASNLLVAHCPFYSNNFILGNKVVTIYFSIVASLGFAVVLATGFTLLILLFPVYTSKPENDLLTGSLWHEAVAI